jgi:methionyl aminopeptidase
MIQIKGENAIAAMRVAGRITAEAIYLGGEAVKDGVSTKHIDDIIRHHIEKCGAVPSFLGYGGFPGSACISINDEVIHGIPSKNRIIKDGDIVSIDVGARYRGYHGDSCCTFGCGRVSEQAKRLMETAEKAFYLGAAKAVAGNRLGDIGSAIQEYVEAQGCGVVRQYVGHGVGRELHEDPEVPNFGRAGHGVRLYKNMTIAIEPMITEGDYNVKIGADGWLVTTVDGKLASHYEHTVLVTDGEPELLTKI